MSPASPLVDDAEVTTFTITVDGQPIDSTYQVESIDTWTAVNKLPRARLVIFDGSAAQRDFPISNRDTFVPGKTVAISAGYNTHNKPIFSGVIVRQGLAIGRREASRLIVDISDPAIRMTLDRKNAIFEDITDSTLIGNLLDGYKLPKSVAETTARHEKIVQYYAADWDLMVIRAELNGLVVIADSGNVTVAKPDTKKKPLLRVSYGETLLDLDLEMDATTQLATSAVKSCAWDPATQTLLESGGEAVEIDEPGNLSSSDLAKVFGVAKFVQQTAGAIAQASLQEWSAGEVIKTKLAKIRGTVRFQGSALATTGSMLELAGAGKRFNGNYFISGVHHRIVDGAWLTTAELGLSPQWFAVEAPRVIAPHAGGQLPAMPGLQTGIVKKVSGDPDGEYRVFVELPILGTAAKGVWARFGTFYGSNAIGAVFFPEVSDEVIVAFMNDDPRFPVIVGSVYSKLHVPPLPPDAKNTKKGIVTSSKLQIVFDETAKSIEIKTPAGQSVKLDDTAGSVVIKDSNSNSVSLKQSGIEINSASSVKISAAGNVTINGANISVHATASATMSGLSVSHTATGSFSAKGSMTSITASGVLTVSGSIVNIN